MFYYLLLLLFMRKMTIHIYIVRQQYVYLHKFPDRFISLVYLRLIFTTIFMKSHK